MNPIQKVFGGRQVSPFLILLFFGALGVTGFAIFNQFSGSSTPTKEASQEGVPTTVTQETQPTAGQPEVASEPQRTVLTDQGDAEATAGGAPADVKTEVAVAESVPARGKSKARRRIAYKFPGVPGLPKSGGELPGPGGSEFGMKHSPGGLHDVEMWSGTRRKIFTVPEQ
jgi:hypothetical protein